MKCRVEEALCHHLGIKPERAEYVHNRLAKFAFGDAPYLYDELRDIEVLERLERSLREIDLFSMTQPASDALIMRVLRGRHQKRVDEGLRYHDAEFDDYVQRIGKPASSALIEISNHIDPILAAVSATKQHIRNSDRRRKALGRMNLQGIQLVAVAHEVWESETGKKAPKKALNNASGFGKYLAELFDVFEVKGDPKAAFRAWVRERED